MSEQDTNKTEEFTEEEVVTNEETSTGLTENLAGMLTYLIGFITGIIFLIIEKENRFVRFHAMQSIGISIVLLILNTILAAIPIIGWLIGLLISPITLIIWLVLLFKAYKGEWFKLPIIGDMVMEQLDQ